MKQENERGIRHRPASFKQTATWQKKKNTIKMQLISELLFKKIECRLRLWGGKSLRSSISEEVDLKHTFILKEQNSLNNVRGALNFYGNDSLRRKLNLNKIFCVNTGFGNCTFTAGKFTNVARNLAKYETVIIATGKTSFWLMKRSKKCLQQYVFIWCFYI